jgi:hypothetical protein
LPIHDSPPQTPGSLSPSSKMTFSLSFYQIGIKNQIRRCGYADSI